MTPTRPRPHLLLLGSCLALLLGTMAGQTAPTPRPGASEPVEIDFAEVYERLVIRDSVYQRLAGEVELRRGDLFIYCDEATIRGDDFVRARGRVVLLQNDTLSVFADSMRYYVAEDVALLFGHVVLVNGVQRVFTDRMRYDVAARRATYATRAKLTDGTAQLSSLRGSYDVGSARATFRDSVFVVAEDFNLIADTLTFDTERRIVYFEGPTVMATPSSRVYTEDGYYAMRDSVGEFSQRAQVARDGARYVADRITFDGRTREFELAGDARFADSTRRAWGDTIRYNERTNRTYLAGEATLIDGEQRVEGDRVDYDGTTRQFSSVGRVNISEPPYLLAADSVSFDDSLGLAYVHGAVRWRDTTAGRAIVADDIVYRRSTEYVLAYGGRPVFSSLVEGDSLHIAADTLISYREAYRAPPMVVPPALGSLGTPDSAAVDFTQAPLDGRALSVSVAGDTARASRADLTPPSKPGPASTVAQPSVVLDAAEAHHSAEHAESRPRPERPLDTLVADPTIIPLLAEPLAPLAGAAGGADSLRVGDRPPLTGEIEGGGRSLELPSDAGHPASGHLDTLATVASGDSLAVRSQTDSLAGFGESPHGAAAPPDSVRRVLAYRNVRVYKSDLQAVADSLAMNSLDSTLTLYRGPIVWSDTSQFTADTIAIRLAGEAIDEVRLQSRAMIVNSPDEVFFNQIKGRRVDVAFAEGEVCRMVVRGNAESVYYILDEQRAYIGVNHVRAARMRFDFADGELSDIRIYEQPEGGIEPIAPSGAAPKLLDDFRWEIARRPRSKADLQ